MISPQDFIQKWPSPVVARQDAAKATGGLISSKQLANLDCQGEGPPQAVRYGRKIAYPAESFFPWIVERLEQVERRKGGE